VELPAQMLELVTEAVAVGKALTVTVTEAEVTEQLLASLTITV
jgi:hypothetical protein